jgi:hypothetical protein
MRCTQRHEKVGRDKAVVPLNLQPAQTGAVDHADAPHIKIVVQRLVPR